MAFNIRDIISDLYSGLSSPSAMRARRDMDLEKKKTLDEEHQRKIELQREIDAGATGRVELTNTGALARQALANTGAERVADISGKASVAGHQAVAEAGLKGHQAAAEATKYSADQILKGHMNPLGLRTEETKAMSAILADPMTPPEDRQTVRERLLSVGKKEDTPVTGIPAFVKPDLPAPGRTTVPATTAPAPIRNTGAKSMEFRSGESPEEAERKRKRMNKIYFQGTKFE